DRQPPRDREPGRHGLEPGVGDAGEHRRRRRLRRRRLPGGLARADARTGGRSRRRGRACARHAAGAGRLRRTALTPMSTPRLPHHTMNPHDLPASAAAPQAAPRLVVIGHGMVGHRLLEELAREAHGYDITVLCAEPRLAYDRVRLSQCFDGASTQDLALADEDFFREHRITVLRDTRAAWIDRKRRRVHVSDEQFHPYDKLVIATGSNPFIPPIE